MHFMPMWYLKLKCMNNYIQVTINEMEFINKLFCCFYESYLKIFGAVQGVWNASIYFPLKNRLITAMWSVYVILG